MCLRMWKGCLLPKLTPIAFNGVCVGTMDCGKTLSAWQMH